MRPCPQPPGVLRATAAARPVGKRNRTFSVDTTTEIAPVQWTPLLKSVDTTRKGTRPCPQPPGVARATAAARPVGTQNRTFSSDTTTNCTHSVDTTTNTALLQWTRHGILDSCVDTTAQAHSARTRYRIVSLEA